MYELCDTCIAADVEGLLYGAATAHHPVVPQEHHLQYIGQYYIEVIYLVVHF